ncbi:MAG TPA: hypothetical protein VFJ57_11945 [Solirubrobacterales bacterium]|nr:hypothetical protein [Solirubrobacterales bacterium]
MLDRSLRISTSGLPVCEPPPDPRPAVPVLDRCTPSRVGHGTVVLYYAFPESKPFPPLRLKALIYNEGTRAGTTHLLIRAPVTVPVPTVIIARLDISRISAGRYGTEAVLRMPTIAEGYGLTELVSLTLDREYELHGKVHGVATLRCPDGKFQASGEAAFVDGTTASAEAIRACRTAG